MDLEQFEKAAAQFPMNYPGMPDGPGWSPDGGYYYVRDGMIYWSDGEVGDTRKGQGPCRLGVNSDYSHVEDFSQWSDEKRAAVLAETMRKRAEYAAIRKAAYEEMERLVEIARGKLTEDEFNAVMEYGRDY
jgi:hypothetical protein